MIKFVHFTSKTRTAVAVEQLISCRFKAPSSRNVTVDEKHTDCNFKKIDRTHMMLELVYLSRR